MFTKGTKLSLLFNVSSNLFAQCISIVFIPILARLYSPADFGSVFVFLGVSSCLVAISSFRFAVTVPLAEDDSRRNTGIVLSTIIILSIFLLLALCFLLLPPVQILKELEGVGSLLVVYFLFASVNNLLVNVVIATGGYRSIGLARITSALTLNITRLIIVSFGLSDGLIYSLVLSEVVASLLLLVACKQQLIKLTLDNIKYNHFKEYIQIYKDYPKYQVLSQLILISTQYAPAFILSVSYSATEVGMFAMANNLVSLPVNSIGVALSQIYLGEFRKKENTPKMLKYSIYILFLFFICSIVAMAVLKFFGESLVQVFLGEKWKSIVPIIILLMILGTAKLCIAVVSQSLNILKAQKLQLFINGIYFSFSYFSLLYSIKLDMSFIGAVLNYTIASVSALLIGLMLIIINIYLHMKSALVVR